MEYPLFEKIAVDKRKLILQSGIREFAHKTYQEASTEKITQRAGISKGLLFHYFDSKKNFYLYCIEQALNKLTLSPSCFEGDDFYTVLFDFMNEKVRLCKDYSEELHLVNMASRESASAVMQEKNELFMRYHKKISEDSIAVINKAISTLSGITADTSLAVEALELYVGAIMNKYLAFYNSNPDSFFENIESIKANLKQYIDCFLYGIIKSPET